MTDKTPIQTKTPTKETVQNPQKPPFEGFESASDGGISKTSPADDTAKNSIIGRPFEKGQSGNPAGRPKGARNKLSEAFLATLADDFDKHGKEAIESLRKSDPKAYLQIITVLTAKLPLAEVNVNNNTLINQSRVMVVTDHGTDAEWEQKLQTQQQRLVEQAYSSPSDEPSET